MELNQLQKELVTQNIKLVYKVATNLKVLRNTDAVQEGILGLCMAASRFNDEKTVKFSTYATCYIRYYILTFLKFNKMIKPCRTKDGIKYAEETDFIEEEIACEDDKFKKFEILDAIYRGIEKADDETKIIVQMYLEGFNQVQIAKKLGKYQCQVSKKLRNLKDIFEGENVYGRKERTTNRTI